MKKINEIIECNYSNGKSMKFVPDNRISDEMMINLIADDSFSNKIAILTKESLTNFIYIGF